MATPTITQPQPTVTKWYQLKGADGKWYKTQASSPEEAKLKVAKQASPPQPSYLREAVEGPVRAVKGMVTAPFQMMKPRSQDEVQYGPAGRLLLHLGQDTMSALEAGKTARDKSKASGENLSGQILATLEQYPIIGGAIRHMESGGPGFTPQMLGGLTELGTYGIAPKILDKGIEAITPTAEGLRTRAAQLNTKVLKQATTASRDYKTSVGLQVAQEGIIASAKKLPEQIEQARVAQNANAARAAAEADKAGKIVDVTKNIKPIIDQVKQVLNSRGVLTQSTIAEINSFLRQLYTKRDLKTGQVIPRDLSKLSVSEAVDLTRHDGVLSTNAEFTKTRTDAVNNLARRLSAEFNDEIGRQAPAVQAARAAESKLIIARDAARENYVKILNDRTSLGKSIIYSGAGSIGAYLGLKALGAAPMAAIGSVVILRVLAESALSRTARAALYARAADILDGGIRANAAATLPQGAPPAAGGGLLPTAPWQLQGGPPNAKLGPGVGQPPNAPPFAPATVVDTNPTASQAASMTRSPLQLSGASTEARSSGAQSTATSQPKIPDVAAVSETPKYDYQALYREAVDEVPRNAMHREQLTKMKAELERALSGKATKQELSTINKHIADRQRLTAKRAESTTTQTGVGTTSTGEPIASTASPEMRSMALDLGYRKLATYDGGPEMVAKIKKLSKEMQKVDPSWDEVSALTEALEHMKSMENLIKPSSVTNEQRYKNEQMNYKAHLARKQQEQYEQFPLTSTKPLQPWED